ncbi:MAG: MopE-related protein, partial [Myxococcota bacterium]
ALSGSGIETIDWHVSEIEVPPDIKRVLSSGTKEIRAELTGSAESFAGRLKLTLEADLEYGTDWDSDGYDYDGLTGGDDCDDDSATINPGETEGIGDGVDQDCDAQEECYQDDDDDGYRTDLTVLSSNLDCSGTGEASSSANSGDCDDFDNTIYPGATELIGDEVDQNCDDQELCYTDGDGDSYRTNVSQLSVDLDCSDGTEAPASMAADDCDDSDNAVNPGATEITGDEADQNCDGDEVCYVDADGDNYRVDDVVTSVGNLSCADAGEARSSTPGNDCDDSDPNTYPTAPEVVGDEKDQDCDGFEACFTDDDADNYRDDESRIGDDEDCTDPTEARASMADGDCDDTEPLINPGVAEIPGDEFDQNCDASELCFADMDGDNYRTEETVASPNLVCTDPGEAAASVLANDCQDDNPAINPGAAEIVADGIDQDCDSVDSCYTDLDNDGFSTGEPRPSMDLDCTDPGESANPAEEGQADCDDDDPLTYPGATELIADGKDQDCNGGEICYVDADSDGFRSADERTVDSVADALCATGDGEALASAELDCPDGDQNEEKFPGARTWDAQCNFVVETVGEREPPAETGDVGCSCNASSSPVSLFGLFGLGLLGLARRRRS